MQEKINRFVDNGLEETIASPMDPPQAYHLSNVEPLSQKDMPASLRILFDEHLKLLDVIKDFEVALGDFKSGAWLMTESVSKRLKSFFQFIDEVVPNHNAMEEKCLFPLLHNRLVQAGECSPGKHPKTSVDVMEDDHIKNLQSAAVIFNFLGLAQRISDQQARQMILQITYDQGRELAENFRLHIFKENEVLFPLAKKHISEQEFEEIYKKMQRYSHECSCSSNCSELDV